MTNKYQMFFEKPYEEIKKVIIKYISNDSVIVDLGCNNGNLEDEINRTKTGCLVYGIDTDAKALAALRNKKYENLSVITFRKDANEFLKRTAFSNIDIILANATIHEMNNHKNQQQYLNEFFEKSKGILKNGGKIIIGDYYYHPAVHDEEVAKYIRYLKKKLGHGDARNKFILPDLLASKAVKHGFSVKYANEIRAVKEIDRRYYSFVFAIN